MDKINLPSERRVGHLKLIRQGGEISLHEFSCLSENEQLDLVRQQQGKDKYTLLINSQRAERLVPRLHPQEIYLALNELGAEDATDLLALASPEQTNLLLDLDCWDNDTLSPILSLHWLGLLLSTGPDNCCRLIRELDAEILALFLNKHLTITHGIEVFDSDDADNAKRLESLYDIDYASEDAAKIIGALLRIWSEQEQESYLLVMEMIRSEQLTTLEEEVYQSRNNRLLDLGILPTSEAKSIYTLIDTVNFETGEKKDFKLEAEGLSHPQALLNQAQPDNLLADILANGISHSEACELLALINRKMSADAIDISAADQVKSAIQSVYDTLNLALESVAGKNSTDAEQVFKSTYLLRLFQLGFSLIEQNRLRAVAISDSAIYPFLDYPELLFIDSLLETPPCLYLPGDDERPASLQRIRTLQEINSVNFRLGQVEILSEVFLDNSPFTLPNSGNEDADPPSLAQLYITAAANQLLGHPFLPEPITTADLRSLREKTIVDGSLDAEFSAQFINLTQQLNAGLSFFADFCLEIWLESFCTDDTTAVYFILDRTQEF